MNSPRQGAATGRWREVPASLVGLLLVLAFASGLFFYKSQGALAAWQRAAQSGSMSAKTGWLLTSDWPLWLRPLGDTANYLGWVIVALTFGLLIGAAVQALLPDRWLVAVLARGGFAGQALASFVGMPLMLCSCCVAPVFEGIYQRTRRAAPAMALMLAAPALNPVALGLTFLLFPTHLAVGRLITSLVLPFGLAGALGRWPGLEGRASTQCPVESLPKGLDTAGARFLSALRKMAVRTLPALLLGMFVSALIADVVPLRAFAGSHSELVVVAVAVVAMLIALPTFGEIPIALGLLAAGAPEGAVLAVLVAGPAVNLPSLITVGRATSRALAAALGAGVAAVSVVAGLLLSLW